MHLPASLATLVHMDGPGVAQATREELTRLQRLLLPATLPPVGCTEVAAAYRPHNDELMLGGDWFDLIDRDDDQVVAIVGDVVGHGVEQISVMGQLRAASNALGRWCSAPHDLLAQLDRFAQDLPGAEVCTMAVLMLDHTNTARLASAGHPPLLHVTGDGEVRVIEGGRRPPLTIAAPFATTLAFEYEVDDLLVLHTDGLVERRGESTDDVTRSLGLAVASMRDLPCSQIVAKLMEEFGSEAEDDVALIVLRPRNHRAPDHLLAPLEEPALLFS